MKADETYVLQTLAMYISMTCVSHPVRTTYLVTASIQSGSAAHEAMVKYMEFSTGMNRKLRLDALFVTVPLGETRTQI